MRGTSFTRVLGGRVTLAPFMVGLLFMGYQVLQWFLVRVAWTLILVYVTWPQHCPAGIAFEPLPGPSAVLMTVVLTLAFTVPELCAITLMGAEAPEVCTHLIGILNQGPDSLPPGVTR